MNGRFMVDANGKTYWKNLGSAPSAPSGNKKGGDKKEAKGGKKDK